MAPIKETYHPNAYLQHVKNVRSGLSARTNLLGLLETQAYSAGTIGGKINMSYSAVMHHLWLLENEGTITRKGRRPCIWTLTGLGQKRLIT